MDVTCGRIEQNRAETARLVQAAIARSQPRQQQVAIRRIRLRITARLVAAVIVSVVVAVTLIALITFGGPLEYMASRLGWIKPTPNSVSAPVVPVADFNTSAALNLRLESSVDLGTISNQPRHPKETP
mgnify:CR=1 FL=1